MTNSAEQVWGAIAVLYIGGVDDHCEHKPERVGEHMALAALDLSAGVEAARSSTLRRASLKIALDPALRHDRDGNPAWGCDDDTDGFL